MQGLMMDRPLLLSGLLEHAARVHGDREVVSCATDEPVHRGSYQGTAVRARQLAGALRALGVGAGDRVATLAYSTHRHLEIFYAAAGSGAVCHTINPRLQSDQIAWILNHAEDAALFVEPAFLAQATAALASTDRRGPLVLMTDRVRMPAADVPLAGRPTPLLCYEDLLQEAADDFPSPAPWPEFDENIAAALCYTSGTTGRPKGVLYSHRSQILHAFAVALPDVAGLSEADSVLPAAPMFHVQAWGIPYAAALTGARLVLPGARLHGAALADLIEEEGVTVALGVPTLWVGLIRYLRGEGRRLSTLKRIIVGGAACPPAMIDAFQREFGVECRHAWGMTEMSPLGTIATLAAKHQGLPAPARSRLQAKQGRPVFGVEIKIVDNHGHPLGARRAQHRRDHGPRAVGVPGLLPLRRDGHPRCRWLAGDRRYRQHRCGRVSADHRSPERSDQVLGRMDQFGGDRDPGDGASGGDAGGGDRHPRREMGREAAADRRAAAGSYHLRAGDPRPL